MLAFMNLCIMIFRNRKNLERVNLIVEELSIIVEMALMIGPGPYHHWEFSWGNMGQRIMGTILGMGPKRDLDFSIYNYLFFHPSHAFDPKYEKPIFFQFLRIGWVRYNSDDLFWGQLLLVWTTLLRTRRSRSSSYFRLLPISYHFHSQYYGCK